MIPRLCSAARSRERMTLLRQISFARTVSASQRGRWVSSSAAGEPERQTGWYRITLEDIAARRKRDGRLVAGTAALADVDSFKTAPDWQQKPKARRWDHLLSKESAARGPCVLKQAAKHLSRPGMISLGGGLPSPEHFPIESLSLEVPQVPTAAGPAAFSDAATTTATVSKHGASEPGATQEYDLSIALNYGQSAGSAQMLRWVTEHTELVCAPPYADWRTCMTVASTGALEQALRIFCDRERGDSMITEEFSFSTALETAEPLGIHVVAAPMDEQGLLPEALEALLAGWDPAAHGGRPKPHLLYTVPSGQNPTGATQGAARRQAIYDVCRRHDLYIFEDEPYYFLQLPPYEKGKPAAEAADTDTETFLKSLIPTLLSIDVDGRVMRMDSFSKVLVPGSRMGWITASEQIVERFMRHGEVCNQGPSGISQAVLYALLDTTWGHRGYLQWLASLQRSYAKRRNVLLDACEEHLPAGLVTWTPPAAGMFQWLRVDHTKHPDYGTRDIVALEEEIFNLCIENGVLVARGSWFASDPTAPPSGLFFRATYAAASHEAMTEAIRRFGEAVRQSFRW